MAHLEYASRAAVEYVLGDTHVPLRVHTRRGTQPEQRAGWAHALRLERERIMIDVAWDDKSREWVPADGIAASIAAGS